MYGSYIRAARERAGLSVADAAKAIKKGADLIYRIERNDADASMDTLDKLATAYNCLIGDLLPNSGAGGATQDFEPLMAALYGLQPEEIRDQINVLAMQARVYRDAVTRRAPLRDVGISRIEALSGKNSTTTETEADLDYRPVGDVPDNHAAAEQPHAGHRSRKTRHGAEDKG